MSKLHFTSFFVCLFCFVVNSVFSGCVHYLVLIEPIVYEISDLFIGQKTANEVLGLLDWTFAVEREVSMLVCT